MRARSLAAMGVAAFGVLSGGLAVFSVPALAAPEAPVTSPATAVTAGSAVLEGTLNPGALAKAGWYFAYSTGLACTGAFTTPLEGEAEVQAQGEKTEVTGLEPRRKYTFCLIATDEAGETTAGNEVSFQTLALKPSVDSQGTSAVSSTGATLEAQVNPNNQETTYSFEYATSKTLAGATTVEGASALQGFGDQTASAPTGAVLEAGEIYYYRVLATNATGTTVGTVRSFATVPTPSTDAVGSVGASSATFNGHFALNPVVASQFFFDYNVGGECTGGSATGSSEAGVGSSTVAESSEVRGLEPLAEYSACFVSLNAYGSEVGPAVHFKTLASPPTVDSQGVSGVSSTDASLEAKVNANNQETTYFFEYAASEATLLEGKGVKLEGSPPAPALSATFGEQQAGPVDIGGGLTPGATYYYRTVAENTAHEKGEAPAATFATLPVPPLVTTGKPQGITRTSAVLTGSVNPGGAETTYRFAYVDQERYEEALAAKEPNPYARGASTEATPVGADYTAHQVGPVQLTNLRPGVTYHYALLATNTLGTTTSPDQTFTTSPPTGPALTGASVSGVGQSTATITTTLDTRGLPTRWELQLGTTPGVLGYQAAGNTGNPEPLTLRLAALTPGTTYYYKLTATNPDGNAQTPEGTLTTSPAPAPPGVAPLTPTPLLQVPGIVFPKDEADTSTSTKPLTNAQKLKNALKACRKKHNHHTRTTCEHQAHKKYPANAKK
jgi:hypothetical protein